ncbi:MAG: phage portal protein [Candidatus Izemoplasmatales bacterium]|nr:phage portal protein [Candidatus Izemoplasmatales bacterium]
MCIFTRKKKEGSTDTSQLLSGANNYFTPLRTNMLKSDVVKICIDRVASQREKFKTRYLKTESDKTVTEKSGRLSFLLKHHPNPLMTPYNFVYKIITLLLLKDNVFIYPMFD